MIPRLLVPRDVRPPAETPFAAPRRLTTLLDNRELVPANWPHIALDATTTIPDHMPLDVLASRVVVPRDIPHTALDPSSFRADYEPVTVMDQRIIVPSALPVVTLESKGLVSACDLPDVLDADVINSGEANLMVEAVEAPPKDWNWKGLMWAASVSVHLLFLLFLLLQPKLFPYRAPTQEQVDLARQQLNFIYMPPDVRGLPRSPDPAPGPAVRVDPRVLRRMAPPQSAMPAPKAPQPQVHDVTPEAPPDLPVAPRPTPQNFLRPQETQTQAAPTPAPQAQTPPTPNGLILPRMSAPGRALQESVEEAGRGGGSSAQFGGPIGRGGGGFGGGGGNGNGMGGGVEMLTPTEGVDFSSYLARVVASVKQNWYSIMPESVYLGDKGRVVLQFRIQRDGGVPDQEPSLMSSSGKDPLDRAASSAIRASSPFQPLPPQFSGPFIELRFIFLYNEPLSQQ